MSIRRIATGVGGSLAAAAALAVFSAAPAHAGAYVAISYSPAAGAYGWGTAATQAQAQDIATGFCIQYGGTDCRNAAWAVNGCVALAVDSDSWQGDYGPTLAAAENTALLKNGGGVIKFSKCSS